jgi:acyl-coenzyme A synthetase/AMP-(fatty) acid ligase
MQTDKQKSHLAVPRRFNPVVDVLERWASREPTALALVSVGAQGQLVQAQTAAELALESRWMARALVGLGVAKGERVLIMMSRVPARALRG